MPLIAIAAVTITSASPASRPKVQRAYMQVIGFRKKLASYLVRV